MMITMMMISDLLANVPYCQDFIELRQKYSESEKVYRNRVTELESQLRQTTKRVEQLETEKKVAI